MKRYGIGGNNVNCPVYGVGGVLSSCKTYGKNSVIADLSPKLWCRQGVGITVTGSGVSQWDDQSGNGNHLKQGTDLDRPSKEADGSILCDGIRQFLVTDAFTELTQPNTIYILFKQVAWTNTDNVYDGISGTKRHALFQTGISPEMKINSGLTMGNALTALPIGSYGAVSTVYNGASSVLQLNNDAPAIGDAGTNGLTGLTLGAKNDATQFANIQVKEILIYNAAHDATTRTKVINFLLSI